LQRGSAILRLWRLKHIFQKSITISLAEVLFAQKIAICLFMTQSTAYVVHCTKGTRGCPIVHVLMLIRKSQLAPGRRKVLRNAQ
jgi:hypothetical protein